ncbi:ligase-associated DNA damage response endonuclease PdeM [Cribrihabitans neustonicus]|uniref:ligase-associated DNA damage response endonuclease PdeM n=1 Tax=Cribrihabitans neustonicus TaxID=1429085 RepID=UPI003B5C6DAA
MTGYEFSFCGAQLTALGSGALWWAEAQTLCVSDLHLGKAERHARRGGSALPPYETRDTLMRLAAALEQTRAACVICLGDSFDDDAAAHALPEAERQQLLALMQDRRWIWIEGNHDPAPPCFGGEHAGELALGPLTFRHIAARDAQGEVSGHYHPKARLRGTVRPAFLVDEARLILPAFGTYTGGLYTSAPVLAGLMGPRALAVLTGPRPLAMPMPR